MQCYSHYVPDSYKCAVRVWRFETRYFVRDVGVTRGHSFKLFKKRVSLDVGRYKFGNRVCND